ncbi:MULTISPECIES: TspO/MBR family protein [unclassified Aureispira]|uniref:TspO/MBR family protein n=1 Tax=unclassified Aureispira TaxID=2649989 RepID=UPI0006967704|nr:MULTISPECIES: TspO/MBR family protein [unclassified Aureispira]WMX17359.1 TspO/MBR family protein [Aureispira sp. CCB-E]
MSSTVLKNLVIFLVINFGALALGGLATNAAVNGEWYQSVNKAPWTPPGWVFGAAWTTIMICFSIFMAYAWEEVMDKTKLAILFGIQWILNVGWNPLFFVYHYVLLGLIVISLLTILVGYFLFGYRSTMKAKAFLMLPYFVWLLIATSLNAYILLYN